MAMANDLEDKPEALSCDRAYTAVAAEARRFRCLNDGPVQLEQLMAGAARIPGLPPRNVIAFVGQVLVSFSQALQTDIPRV
jgi:hypothetical protein